MKTSLHSTRSSQTGFALISVLALVSLAALTATAFLASARLERSATRPIGETTRLQMALNTGRECAAEVLNRVGEPNWNFVTTYWRTNLADELGYPLVGKASATNNLVWYYYCGFTPATWTNLVGTDMNQRIRATNTICQATFSNDIANFMVGATAGFTTNPPANSKICTEIPMVGGRTSRPVGWVYIKQDIRTNTSTTNTINVPVARFAYFIEDLQGLIDAERMGGLTTRTSGTNSEEIAITNATGTSGGTIVSAANLANFTSNRGQYITPSMLLQTNGGVIANTNDLRYFASRLRSCYWRTTDNCWDRVPMVPISSTLINNSHYPALANSNKTVLNNLNLGGQSDIVAAINTNFPMFTNRAGGMNGQLYVNALAANIVDYADNNSSPTIVNVGGVNAVGFDSYPILTQLFDQFVCTQTGTAPPVITVTTYLQFWNPSSSNSVNTQYTLLYDFADRIGTVVFTNASSTNSNVVTSRMFLTNDAYTNQVGTKHSFSNNLTILTPSNHVTITRFVNTYSLNLSGNPPTGFAWTNFSKVWINGTSGSIITNPFTLRFGTNDFIRPKNSFYRSAISLTNNETNWLGTILGLRFGGGPIPAAIGWASQSRLPADPRMLNYLTSNPTTNGSAVSYASTFWGGYPAETTTTNIWGNPGLWPDGTNDTVTFPTRGRQYAVTNSPPTGTFAISDPPPCKISNNNAYTNICELGNIFDPIQWAPPVAPPTGSYANCNINTKAGSVWTTNSMYGGGSTLRIGRPEHSRFAFTNLTTAANSYPVPALGTSAVGLLDIFCVTNTYDWGGKININTAPLPVLAALAGGISLNTDNYSGTAPANADMIRAFTNGVARFRKIYPFITPSQLAFISSDYGIVTSTASHWTNTWPTNAVFATNNTTGLIPGGLLGPTAMNDEGREEWFSKIYNLTTVQSFNYRIYVKAQLTDTNGNPKGPEIRKYYQLYLRNNSPAATSPNTPSVSPVVTYEAFY